VAAQRAKQLLKCERPKIRSKYKNQIRVAEEEVRSGAVQYEILPYKPEEAGHEEVILTEALPLEAAETETEGPAEEHDLAEPEEEEIGAEDLEELDDEFEIEEDEIEDEDQSDDHDE
jgi:hypothetical protein